MLTVQVDLSVPYDSKEQKVNGIRTIFGKMLEFSTRPITGDKIDIVSYFPENYEDVIEWLSIKAEVVSVEHEKRGRGSDRVPGLYIEAEVVTDKDPLNCEMAAIYAALEKFRWNPHSIS